MGAGYTKKLEAMGLYTMDDIARCSLGKPTDFYNEDTLYDVFGVNAEPIARELHENGIFWFSLSRPSLSTGFAPVELFTKSRTTQNHYFDKEGALHGNRRVCVHRRRDWGYIFLSLADHS